MRRIWICAAFTAVGAVLPQFVALGHVLENFTSILVMAFALNVWLTDDRKGGYILPLQAIWWAGIALGLITFVLCLINRQPEWAVRAFGTMVMCYANLWYRWSRHESLISLKAAPRY